MKKACIVVNKYYKNNRLFDLADPYLNKDNCLYGFHLLRKSLRDTGYDLGTDDINGIENSELVIFNDMPETVPRKKPGQLYFLLAMESIAVRPEGLNPERYVPFDRVFTWNDALLDGGKIIKIRYFFPFDKIPALPEIINREKFACLFANNKVSSYPGELYSERLRTIDWFEKNHPEDFDLYGRGWQNLFPVNTLPGRIMDKLRLSGYFPVNSHKCYRGFVLSKIPALQKYRFNICFENVKDGRGYVTEKLFDAFFGGCIPVYWGAPNVTDDIPAECFIDRRQFGDTAELYSFMKEMTEKKFLEYYIAIVRFLESGRKYPFTAECFVKTVCDEIAKIS